MTFWENFGNWYKTARAGQKPKSPSEQTSEWWKNIGKRYQEAREYAGGGPPPSGPGWKERIPSISVTEPSPCSLPFGIIVITSLLLTIMVVI